MVVKRTLMGGLTLCILATAGCYESGFPIDPQPQAEGDGRLMGAWRCVPNNADVTEHAATIRVAARTERTYAITFQEDGKDADHYEAYASVVGGQKIFNTRELDGGSKPWVFVRYTFFKPSVLQLQLLSGDMLKEQTSPTALRAAIERLQESSTGYVDLCTCVRAREPRD